MTLATPQHLNGARETGALATRTAKGCGNLPCDAWTPHATVLP
jgi:hypothetical protein